MARYTFANRTHPERTGKGTTEWDLRMVITSSATGSCSQPWGTEAKVSGRDVALTAGARDMAIIALS